MSKDACTAGALYTRNEGTTGELTTPDINFTQEPPPTICSPFLALNNNNETIETFNILLNIDIKNLSANDFYVEYVHCYDF